MKKETKQKTNIKHNVNYISAIILLIGCYFVGLTLSIGIILAYYAKQKHTKLVGVISIIMINIWVYGFIKTILMFVMLGMYGCIIWYDTVSLVTKSLIHTYVKYKVELKTSETVITNQTIKEQYIKFGNIIFKVYYFFQNIIKWISLYPDVEYLSTSKFAKQIGKIIVEGTNTINFLIDTVFTKFINNSEQHDKYLDNNSFVHTNDIKGDIIAKNIINSFFNSYKNV